MGGLRRSCFARNETHRLMRCFDGFALSLLPILHSQAFNSTFNKGSINFLLSLNRAGYLFPVALGAELSFNRLIYAKS